MRTQKITASKAKLDAWEKAREMDRRAIALVEQGYTFDQAYRIVFGCAKQEDLFEAIKPA